MNNYFISDLKEHVGSLASSSGYVPHFKQYEITEIEGKEYLVGYEHKNKKGPVVHSSPKLLFDFVGLVAPPLPHWLKNNNKAPMKKALPDKRLIKFCKKYGLPYVENSESGHCIELEHFRWRISRLYSYFRVWQAVFTGHDEDGYLKQYTQSPLVGGKRDQVNKCLALEVSLIVNNNKIHLEYDEAAGRFVLGIAARNLIDIAYFHLANLLTYENKYIKQHLKKCNNPRCSQLFWADHGRKKYCEYCDRRVVHAQQGSK